MKKKLVTCKQMIKAALTAKIALVLAFCESNMNIEILLAVDDVFVLSSTFRIYFVINKTN